MSSLDCTIREVRLKNKSVSPLIVNFEHGLLRRGEEERLECGVFANRNNPMEHVVASVAPQGDIIYQGLLSAKSKEVCHTFIAVRNKKSNKIRLYESDYVDLSPSVCGSRLDVSVSDYKTAAYNLSHAFGSKRSKKIADQRRRMDVNVDHVKDKLSSTASEVCVHSTDLVIPKDDGLENFLPPCNRNAKIPSAVYNIGDILNKDELESLESFALKYAEGMEEVPEMSQFYRSIFDKIPVTPNQLQQSALLLYAESLISFCNMNHKTFLTQIGNYCPYSNLVSKRMTDELTAKSGRTRIRSTASVDKAIMLIIILALHVSDFRVNLDLLASTLIHVNINRIKLLASIVGTVPDPSDKRFVILKTPLPPARTTVKFMRTPSRK